MTILDALDDPHLLGHAFAVGDWSSWRVALRAMFGLGGMTEAELELFTTCTGRSTTPTGPAKEAWLCVGRRGGKSRVSAAVAVYLAAFRDYAGILSAGEVGTLHVIAPDRRQARVVLGYIKALLDQPLLRQLVVAETAESIELSTRIRIEVGTASFRSLRGYTCVGAVLDEVCFLRSDDSANPDREVLAALRPSMATVPSSMLVAISSPYARRGVMWDAYRRAWGKDGDCLVWQAPSRVMNPTLPAALVEQALADDEASARAEYLAEFRSDLEAFVSREIIDACTVPGRVELPPVDGVEYVAFVDPSGGSQDSFTLAIAHRDGDVGVLDVVLERRPPFSPDAVVAGFCALLKAYRVRQVEGDRYGGGWPAERFDHHGVSYRPSEQVKSEIYATALPLLNSRRVELPDSPRLHAQLLGLERRVARGGKDSIDHGPGAHDDIANAAAGALVLAVGERGGGLFELVRREYEASIAAQQQPGTTRVLSSPWQKARPATPDMLRDK